MKKIVVFLAVSLLLIIAACNGESSPETGGNDDSNGTGSSERAEISILIGKPEIAREFERAVADFTEETNIDVTIIPLAGANAFERMSSLYSSGNAPTVMMLATEYEAFQDRLLDLSDEPWMDIVHPGMTDFITVDGAVYGQPVTVEAFGFIYNQAVLNEVVGGEFDPTTVRTHDELRSLFEEIDALDGVDAIHVSPMDWSLGAHYTNPIFAAQSEDREERHQFMQDVLGGNVSLSENDVFNGWLETFELMKEFNSAKNSPLAPQYDDGPMALANGEVGLWFMGNWAYPQLHEIDPDGQYGFLPVPISNDANDFGNQQISVGVPSFWAIDESQSTEEERESAKEFLNWLVYSETGQEHYVNGLNFIPVYDNFTVQPEDSVSLSVLEYMNADNTLEWMNLYYPLDGYPVMGALLQRYLSDNMGREEFIEEFEDYWHNAAN